jgi:predicted secreted hydrolase
MRPYLCALVLLLAPLGVIAAPAPLPAPAPAGHFGVAAHSDVNIEWWYVNAHVTTEKGRHLALIGSFFRFGSGVNPLDGSPMPRAHYLIYAVTDLDAKTQRPYSLADGTMINLLKQFGPLLAMQNPGDKSIQTFMADINKGKLPPPSQEISGKSSVVNSPFHIAYGADNTLAATNSVNTSFVLNLNAGGPDKIHLTLVSQKPPMAVGGKGETGLKSPTDMYYFSLTRCAVGGTVDTGTGPEKITGGAGWFDHQWGNSWVASNDGWDWWGVQLDDGTDILFFRQRDLKTGRIFYPLATFMDKDGHQSVTKNIVFTPDPKSYWKSPKSGVTYPLGWTVAFPDHSLSLHIVAEVKDQEMPILGPGAGIWEGLCRVDATHGIILPSGQISPNQFYHFTGTGVAYMELVGYGSPAVKAKIRGKGK